MFFENDYLVSILQSNIRHVCFSRIVAVDPFRVEILAQPVGFGFLIEAGVVARVASDLAHVYSRQFPD